MLIEEMEKKISKIEKKIYNIEHRLSAREFARRKMRPIGKTMLTTSEAAAYTGLKVSTLQRMARLKQIEYFKPAGKNLYFDISVLDAWLRQNPQPASAD